jgi:hypothetical protein
MKISKLALASAIALFSSFGAMAATAVSDPNAVLLGFRATADAATGANSFLFVGLNGFGSQSFDFSSQLSTQFGSNWFSNGNIRWGVYSVNVNEDTDGDGNYVNYGKTIVGSVTNSGIVLADGDFNGVIPAAGVLDSIKINLGAAGISDTTGGYSYGVLSGADYTAASGLASAFQGLLGGQFISYPGEFDLSQITSLDLNRFVPNSAVDAFGTYSIPGVVSVASSGQITVVPEPSTYALFGLGALLVVGAVRRARKA